jgi:phenylpropionate dioxygenase-like ring-hydroxylating dioxygenase large terminal subunit
MLTKEENEYITRVGPGTPMGNLFRHYWMPALLSHELPEPDGAPVQVRILGEDLVAYRDSGGQVGLLGEFCPHRKASLFLGRNEEHGLRCVYHGWKFDTTGACTDMPNEPAESNFRDKIRHTAYPCRDAGGVVWAWMGPRDRMPELPQFEWTLVPDTHRTVSKLYQANNWLQGVEGGIDSSHVSFLHSSRQSGAQGPTRTFGVGGLFSSTDTAPKFSLLETDYGFLIGASRTTNVQDLSYWRLTPFMLPFYTVIPGRISSGEQVYSGHAWVPIDDYSTWMVTYSWHPAEPIAQQRVHPAHYVPRDPATFKPLANRSNWYGLDRQMQKTENYTGIANGSDQDRAVQETMGPIVDRTTEHLGTSDTAVIAARRTLIRQAHDLESGREPAPAWNPAAFRLRSLSCELPAAYTIEQANTAFQARQPSPIA